MRTCTVRTLRGESGQDLLEYALVLPLFLLILFGTLEIGFLTFQFSTVTNIARESARAGLLPLSTACDLGCRIAAAESAGVALASSAGLTGIVISADSSTSEVSRVTVTYSAGLMTAPFIEAVGGTGTISLNASASMQRE
ncbi:MAG: TadE/TadG family type IV pilus assembly protein [Caldilineaceae bacterium]